MRISIITAVLNGASSVEYAIRSVLGQTCPDIEYIIVDGGSTDGTLEVIKKYEHGISRWISGPDKGIYDALNKGLKMATGEVIGILHSDDFYAHERVISDVAAQMEREKSASCYGDLFYVDKTDTDKVVRYWRSRPYKEGLFHRGWMPPHPTLFVRKEIYDKYGLFNTDFRIAADYELMLRFLEKHKISTTYIPEVLVKMRVGGESNRSLRNVIIKSREDYSAWKTNGLRRKFYTIPFKNLSKIPQFWGARPSR